MARHLDHRNWVAQQFDKYLNKSYRDVIIHTSIIEGILRKESKKDKFDLANKSLLCSGKITSSEFCVFNEIRDIRNSLIHDSFKNELVQDEIDKLRNELLEKILEAYRTSKFLDQHLFKKYGITRKSIIKYEGSI